MSTTFVNRSIEETVLLDLKHLLIEAKQKCPSFCKISMASSAWICSEVSNTKSLLFLSLANIKLKFILNTEDQGCTFCGGLGHRITNCPKLEAQQSKTANNLGRKEYLAKGSADW